MENRIELKKIGAFWEKEGKSEEHKGCIDPNHYSLTNPCNLNFNNIISLITNKFKGRI